MVFSEVLKELKDKGFSVSRNQLRWAIVSHKVKQPRLDGSLKFDFSEKNVDEIAEYFEMKQAASV